MTYWQIRRLVRLHEKATRHSENYKKLSGDLSAQSKALDHLKKAERLYFQISGIIRNINSTRALIGGEKFPGFQSLRVMLEARKEPGGLIDESEPHLFRRE
jgi:hypothetical protein